MSTTNIPGLNAQRAAARKTASNVRGRATQIRKDLDDLENEKNDVRVAAAAMLEDIANDEDPLLEEAEELTRILGAGTASPAQPAAAAPVAPAQPVATPATPIVVPPAVQQTPATPAPAPTATQPVAAVAPAPATQALHPGSVRNWRNWTRIQWVLAIVLGIIAASIASQHRSNANNWAGIHDGFAVWVLRAIWILLFAALGFIVGGALGWSIQDGHNQRANPPAATPQAPRPGFWANIRDGFRLGRNRARQQVNNPNPPAPPATSP